jgi:hypothetical protein
VQQDAFLGLIHVQQHKKKKTLLETIGAISAELEEFKKIRHAEIRHAEILEQLAASQQHCTSNLF